MKAAFPPRRDFDHLNLLLDLSISPSRTFMLPFPKSKLGWPEEQHCKCTETVNGPFATADNRECARGHCVQCCVSPPNCASRNENALKNLPGAVPLDCIDRTLAVIMDAQDALSPSSFAWICKEPRLTIDTHQPVLIPPIYLKRSAQPMLRQRKMGGEGCTSKGPLFAKYGSQSWVLGVIQVRMYLISLDHSSWTRFLAAFSTATLEIQRPNLPLQILKVRHLGGKQLEPLDTCMTSGKGKNKNSKDF